MINPTSTSIILSVPIPITRTARQIARKFAQQEQTPEEAKRIRFNTLAVCAVKDYLEMLGISTNLSAGDSWNPIMRTTFDVADLEVTGLGRLECRPILVQPEAEEIKQSDNINSIEDINCPKSTEPICYVPPEVRDNRIGYVVVRIDEEQQEAMLLGFTKTVDTDELPLTHLHSMKDLLVYLSQLEQSQLEKRWIHLSQWFQRSLREGWLIFEELLGLLVTQSPELAYTNALFTSDRDIFRKAEFRNATAIANLVELLQTSSDESERIQVAELLGRLDPDNPKAIAVLTDLANASSSQDMRRQAAISLGKLNSTHARAGVRGAKVIDLGIQIERNRVMLVVTLMPEESQKINIHLRVYPIDKQAILPPHLQLIVLDENCQELRSVQSRSADNLIQIEFSGDVGDRFSVKLALDSASFIENFLI